jgi:RNA polymerase sigma-70 factor (ECF subfamily)
MSKRSHGLHVRAHPAAYLIAAGTVIRFAASGTAAMSDHVVDGNQLLGAIAQDRDRAAFAQLFRHYAPRLKSHLLGRGVGNQVAEELVQEVMLSAWRRAELFDPMRGSASSWLFAMVRNALIDRVRRERRPEPVPDPEEVGLNADCPEQALLTREGHQALQRALLRLPPEQATVLSDAYFRGQSMSEIARERNLPLGTVKTRTRLALERLRTEMVSGRESA